MSYVDSEKEGELSPEEGKKEKSIFEYLERIIDAVTAKDAQLAHHLDRIATALEKIERSQPVTPVIAPTTGTSSSKSEIEVPQESTSFIDDVKTAFSLDLQELLKFEDKGDWIRVAPRRFLGSDNFAKIASIIRSLGGEYKSEGKDSHFKIVKK